MDRFSLTDFRRLPVHVFYGGAHLFRQGVFAKMGAVALASPLAGNLDPQVRQKLETEPVEDFRIDFEDGFGFRPEQEELSAAAAAGLEFLKCARAGELPARVGIRLKADCRHARNVLSTFLKYAVEGPLPKHFVVTQPKLERAEDAKRWREMLEHTESHYSLPGLTLRHEILVERPGAVRMLPEIAKACENRLDAAHFGCYDYLSSMNVPFAAQSLSHPYAVAARWAMHQVLTPLGIPVSDGAVQLLPTSTDLDENKRALDQHSREVERALGEGFYCGWDLHPVQLISRYETLYRYFRQHLAEARRRYREFLAGETKARASGTQFDDAATVEGLLVFLRQGLSCGAFSEQDLA